MMTSPVCILVTGLVIAVTCEPYYKTEEELRKTLFVDYDKKVPPLENIKDNVTLVIGITLLSIDDLDVTKEVLKTNIWPKLMWNDIRLTWNPAEYSGQDHISVPVGDLWKPDITAYNNADVFSLDADYAAVVVHDGEVVYNPYIALTTTCGVDLGDFPFDEHTCKLKFGSWTYSNDVVSLVAGIIDATYFEDNNVWLLANYSHDVIKTIYPCCPETYSSYEVTLVLRRRTGLLMNMYVAPAACIRLVLPSVFLLPSGSTSKMVLGSSLFIGQVLLLEMLVDILPLGELTTPRLLVFYLTNVVLISVTLIISSIVVYPWQRSSRINARLPRLVEKIIIRLLGRILCVRREDYVSDNGGSEVAKEGELATNSRSVAPAEWRQLAAILDRLFMIVFLVVAVSTIVTLFL